jgi:hypothetical protein
VLARLDREVPETATTLTTLPTRLVIRGSTASPR